MMRTINELIGRNGLINDFFAQTQHRQFLPKELITLFAQGRNLKQTGFLVDVLSSGATDFTLQNAALRTVGEFCERLLGARFDSRNAIYGSYNALCEKNTPCLHPDRISLFAPWQYEQQDFTFKQFSVTEETYWIPGKNLSTGERVYIPHFLVYWSYIPDQGASYLIQTSTGLAAGRTLEDAIAGGFLEVWERHAFSMFWYLQKNESPITYDKQTILSSFLDPRIGKLFQNDSVEIKTFDLGKYAPVEVMFVLMTFNYKNRNHYSCGAAASFSKKEAIIKACLEAYQLVELSVEQYKRYDWRDYRAVLPSLINFETHANFYNAFPELRLQCPVFLAAANAKGTHDQMVVYPDKLTSLEMTRFISDFGNDTVYYVDLTDKPAIGLPLHVARVVIPSCIPLTGNHNFPFLGHENFKGVKNLFIELPHCLA